MKNPLAQMQNLSDNNAARQSEIVIDSAASRMQAFAMLSALKEKYASVLGKVTGVRYAPINLYIVRAPTRYRRIK